MKRRSFLKTSSLALSAFFVTRSISARERLHEAWMKFGGPSIVKGARPVPPFTATMPAKGEGMRFLVMGDWGTGASGQASVARAMARTADRNGCDYIISTGDNIYPKGVASADDPQWKRKFEDIYAGQGLKQPVFPTLGNHDYGLEPDAQIAYAKVNPQWRFPSRYYSQKLTAHDGTTVELFSLDTQRVQTNVPGAAEEQRKWLDEALGKSNARWKIVFGHHMLYSNGIYGNLKRIRDTFEDVLVRHKVAAYLCGHDHDIQFLRPVNGVSYIVSGGGGGHRDTSWGENTIYAATNMGYVWMAATKDAIHLQFLDADGNVKYAQKLG
jgi:acid phosphatase